MSNPNKKAAGRILIVDDDVDSREPFAEYLRINGFAVEECATGALTLESVAREAPALVVMDIALDGDMDGYELARKLRRSESTKTVPLIALTGFSMAKVKLEGDLFDAVLTKPVNAEELVRIVTSLSR